jgi:hypothetical protein
VAWRGSARAATTTPNTGKVPSIYTSEVPHCTPPEATSTPGEASRAREEERGSRSETLGFGRRRIYAQEEAIDKISRMARCAIARSTRCAPSRRLTPAKLAGIEGQRRFWSQELRAGEERGGDVVHLAGSSLTEPGWSGPTHYGLGPTGGARVK